MVCLNNKGGVSNLGLFVTYSTDVEPTHYMQHSLDLANDEFR